MARVLVVEGEPDIRDSYERMLEAVGHVVSVAHDGHTGLDLLKRETFDVVLTGDPLPGLTGRQMLVQAAPYLRGRTARMYGPTVEAAHDEDFLSFADLCFSAPKDLRRVWGIVADALRIRYGYLHQDLHASIGTRAERVAARSNPTNGPRDRPRPLRATPRTPRGDAADRRLQQLLGGHRRHDARSAVDLAPAASTEVRARVEQALAAYWEAECVGKPLQLNWVASPLEACRLLAVSWPGPDLTSCVRRLVEAVQSQRPTTLGRESPLKRAAARELTAELYDRHQTAPRRLRPGLELAAFHGIDLQHLGAHVIDRVDQAEADTEPVAALLRTLRELVGWFWLYDDGYAVVTERHGRPRGHEDGRLHADTGRAVAYPDGFGVWALNGLRVPPYAHPGLDGLTVEKIRRIPNAELRHALREQFGMDRYLREIRASLIECDTVPVDRLAPRAGSLTRALIETQDGHRYLVSSDGSTGRVYYMRVPHDCVTCKEAYDALSGRPGARTIVEA